MSILELKGISASYGDLKVLHDIDLNVDSGEIVALLGSNGAGKTTTLRVIAGFVAPSAGTVTFDGINLLKKKPFQRAELQLAHIPQGRGTVAKQTVFENLILGAYNKKAKVQFDENLAQAYDLFPKLQERKKQIAGSLSGGEQQMLAIARALMMNPKMIIMDEPSLGLAPIIVEEVFEVIERIAKEKNIAVLLVEQNLVQALSIANRGYVLENGVVSIQGDASDLLNDPRIMEAYLGI